MNKQQKVQELAEKLMDGLDDADLNDAILLFPKCRAAGEDQDNAVEHLVDEIVKGQNGKYLDEAVMEELKDLAREKIKKTPIKK